MSWFSFFKREHPGHQHRRDGFASFSKEFASHPDTPDVDVTVKIPVTIHVVGERSKFEWERAKDPTEGVGGYANSPPRNEIWIFGKRVNGQIIMDQAILGHELQHLLKWNAPGETFANPDKLIKVY